MKLYTKQGDKGLTQLLNGQRVAKNDGRVAAYGQVDELNATIGWAICACDDSVLVENIRRIQDRLFVLGAQLADPDARTTRPVIVEQDIAQLEGWIDQACSATTALKSFVLPGGSEAAARLHLARTVCRRVEREMVSLCGTESENDVPLIYVNRLSDLLFAWARWVNAQLKVPDIEWHADQPNP